MRVDHHRFHVAAPQGLRIVRLGPCARPFHHACHLGPGVFGPPAER
jgi:hypothetical protein